MSLHCSVLLRRGEHSQGFAELYQLSLFARQRAVASLDVCEKGRLRALLKIGPAHLLLKLLLLPQVPRQQVDVGGDQLLHAPHMHPFVAGAGNCAQHPWLSQACDKVPALAHLAGAARGGDDGGSADKWLELLDLQCVRGVEVQVLRVAKVHANLFTTVTSEISLRVMRHVPHLRACVQVSRQQESVACRKAAQKQAAYTHGPYHPRVALSNFQVAPSAVRQAKRVANSSSSAPPGHPRVPMLPGPALQQRTHQASQRPRRAD